MLGVLEIALARHPVTGELGVARQRLVLVDDLLGRTPDLAVRPRALEDAVDDVAHGVAALGVVLPAVVALLVAGAGLVLWSHVQG